MIDRNQDHYGVLFTFHGKRYYLQCPDPGSPPVAPDGATDTHLVIPPDKQAPFERVSQEEARECFKHGFLEAGGKPGDLDKYWQAVTKPAEAPRKPLWYEEPDESELPI